MSLLKIQSLLFFLFFPFFLSAQTSLTSAIDFTATDLNGDTIQLFDILDAGKYVILDFSTNSCFPCQNNAPILDQAYRDFGCNSADVFFIGVNQEGNNQSVLQYVITYDIHFPYISGINGGGDLISSIYGVSQCPTVVLIAPNHLILEQDLFPVSLIVPVLEEYGIQQNSCDNVLIADFIISPQTITVGGSISLFDMSAGNPDTWGWQFSGGSPIESSDQNPFGISYSTTGNFPITLNVTKGFESDSRTLLIHVVPQGAPNVDFQADVVEIFEGENVNFEDLTLGTPISWSWTFVGGNPVHSTLKDPQGIVYSYPGEFNVYLTASNSNGSGYLTKQKYIRVKALEPPVQFCDTITNLLPFDSLMVMTVTGGYLPGNNDLGILEYADLFTNTNYDQLTGLIVPVEVSQSNFATSKIRFKIWQGGQSPGQVIGYKDVLLDELVENFYYLISFNPPVSLSGDFYIGYQLSSGAGDNFATSMAKDRGFGESSTMFVKLSQGWFNISTLTQLGEITSSLGINPVVCNSTGIFDEISENSGIQIYPNPSKGIFGVILPGTSAFNYRIYNMLGECITSGNTQGIGYFEINLSDQLPGVYFIHCQNSKEKANYSKVLILK